MATDRITRLTALFSEGTEVLLGFDNDKTPAEPVVVWVNKLNSFETQEARADGSARRSERMHQLGKADSPEKLGYDVELSAMSHEQLAQQLVESKADEIYLSVLNDIEMDPDFVERRDRIERLPSLLEDAGAADDDPRREQLHQDHVEWLQAIADGQKAKQLEAYEDAFALSPEDLHAALWEGYRHRQTLDVFMAERSATQIYFAMRVCKATDVGTEIGQHKWDHAGCDHSEKYLDERKDVRALPEAVLAKITDAIDEQTVNPRVAGNSDAPASSSASLEPASAPEAASTPSTPEETSPALPTS